MKRSSAISRGLCLALLATTARGQTVAAGARAVVSSETLPVYNSMSATSPLKTTLERGEAVTIGLVLFGDDVTWCAISKSGETKRLGYASCEFLEPERPASAATPAPRKAMAPIPVRDVPRPAITIPEGPVIPATAAAAPVPEPALAKPTLPEPAPPPPVAPKETAPPQTVATLAREPAAEPVGAPPPAPVAERSSPPPVETTPAAVEPPAPTSVIGSDLVDSALDDSGLRSSLASYTENTNLLSFVDKSRLAEINIPQLEAILSKQFQPTAFYASIGEQLRKNYSTERMSVVEWLRSPVTKKMSELERKALQPESREGLVEFAAGLSKAPPAESRLLLVHRLYDSVKTCDMEVDVTISLVQTVALAIGPVLPKEKRYSAAELEKALGPVKSRYRSIMKNARLVRYLFAYQSVSDAEFEEHVAFLESENGKWFVSQVEKGFSDAGEAISTALAREIPRNLKPKRP